MITNEYRKQLQALHEKESTWGNGPRRYMMRICKWVLEENITEVLDYGCGKGKNVPFILPITVVNYDPGVPSWSADPRVCTHLMCIDVIEHIEPEYLDEVLQHIASKFTVGAMLNIALTESRHFLPDGRNAHILLKPTEWWIPKLKEFFTLKTMEFRDESITVFITPKKNNS